MLENKYIVQPVDGLDYQAEQSDFDSASNESHSVSQQKEDTMKDVWEIVMALKCVQVSG